MPMPDDWWVCLVFLCSKQGVQRVVQQVIPLLHLAGDTVTFEMEKDPVTSLVDINISLGGESYFPQTKESVTEA